MIGFAMCGSYCTHRVALAELRGLLKTGLEICPILSENAYTTDTRFGKAEDLIRELGSLCHAPVIHTVKDAEPLGPSKPLDALILCPCTGNTLAKLAAGITDTSVTMAAKAHLRCDRPLLIALASNDAMSQNLPNLARILERKGAYLVPMRQDDPIHKPHSLVADFSLIDECLSAALSGRQLRPLFI